jgi:glycosyltransferase involved in cell wall biosynthesis
MSKLKVAMIAPPWLKIPPKGYGGIEMVLDYLVPELKKLGCDITLYTIGATKIPGIKTRYVYEDEQYSHIHKELYDVAAIPLTQAVFALNDIREDGDFDIIHNHNGYIGDAIMAFLDPEAFPPVVNTLHGPIQNHENPVFNYRSMYAELSSAKRSYYVGISDALVATAPKAIQPQILGTVHNAVKLEDWPFVAKKDDYFITLARFTKDKGQDIAIRLCQELGYRLKMSGVVAGITNARRLMLELANPLSKYRNMDDFKYYSDEILPHIDPGHIDYVGNASDADKVRLVSKARALLFPIRWHEPFGVAVIEALACGTPVIAMKKGSMPEIIEHGVNGFLAKNEEEFRKYMQRVDEIDPAACRKSVEDKFSAPVAAQKYLDMYHEAIYRSNPFRAMGEASRAGLLQAGAFAELLDKDAEAN